MNISPVPFNQVPESVHKKKNRSIASFPVYRDNANIDASVVESFGEEWTKFNQFSEADLAKVQREYFDILDEKIINKGVYGIDIGCGTGRWTKCLLDRIGFMEAIDPSDAIYAADELLKDFSNVRLSRAATDNIPFADGTFDFGMSIGVLHHIPDTAKALRDCVKKVKPGGYFYVYLYYSLDNKGPVFKAIFGLSNLIRRVVSGFSAGPKKLTCDVLAVTLYMPFVLTGRALRSIGLKKIAASLPLSPYQNKSFHIIRNDALDRFGTSLEQRFSRTEVIEMMETAGLSDIVVSPNMPYWHATGKRTR